MDYADRLRTLPRPDLEELLTRRSETFVLASRSTVGYTDLAALLAQPYGTQRALDSLDRFHGQVLQLAVIAGGRLDGAFAEQQGLDPGLLSAAAAELARSGLGFLDDRGALVLPRTVLAAVDDPGALGPPLAVLLEGQRADDLRQMAGTLGLGPGARRKAELVEELSDRLADATLVRELVAEAPPKAAQILEAVRRGGGVRAWTELAREVPGIFAERGLMHSRRPPAEGVPWLRQRGLVLTVEWDQRLAVPAEVELALRGRVFPTWEPEPPPLELVPLETDRHPVELVTEVTGLLDLWRRGPVELLQSGDLGVRECQRAARALGVPQAAVRFLASLTVAAGLVAVEEPPLSKRRGRGGRRVPEPLPGRLVVVDEAARQWRAVETAERWTALVRPWRDMVGRLEEPTRLVLGELASLPAGSGAAMPGLSRRLAWRHPAHFPHPMAAAEVLTSTAATLHRLGVGPEPSAPVAGLSELGRTVLGGDDVGAVFPAAEAECTVQADLRIIVAGPPEPGLATVLARLADLETASPARVYRMSEASLRRALDEGMTAPEIAAFLDTRCPTGLPQNVAALIEDVGRRHGRLRVGAATLYLQAEDPALLAEVAANRRLRGLRVTLLAPTVAVVQGTDEAAAVEALRRAGYMPGVDGTAMEAPRGAAARRRRVPPPQPAPAPGLTAAERRALADRLLDGSHVPTAPRERGLDDDELLSGITVSGRDVVERLMRLAVRSGRVVEIKYRNQQSGSISTRVIEPRLAGEGTVVGWCRLRHDDRAFAFDGVQWARATGEAVQHVGLGAEDR